MTFRLLSPFSPPALVSVVFVRHISYTWIVLTEIVNLILSRAEKYDDIDERFYCPKFCVGVGSSLSVYTSLLKDSKWCTIRLAWDCYHSYVSGVWHSGVILPALAWHHLQFWVQPFARFGLIIHCYERRFRMEYWWAYKLSSALELVLVVEAINLAASWQVQLLKSYIGRRTCEATNLQLRVQTMWSGSLYAVWLNDLFLLRCLLSEQVLLPPAIVEWE